MKKIIILTVLISNIITLTAAADQTLSSCNAILGKLTAEMLFAPKLKQGRLEEQELKMLYTIRGRMNTSGSTKLETQQEAYLLNQITGKLLKIGDTINIEQFESALIKVNERFAFWLAGKFYRSQYHIIDIQDLVQAAKIGLLYAIRNYNPEHTRERDGIFVRANFPELAELYMRTEINQAIKDTLPLAMPNASLLSSMFIVSHIASDLTFQNKGKRPTAAAILFEYQRLHPDNKSLTLKKIERLLERKAALDSVFSIFEREQNADGEPMNAEIFLPPNKQTPENILEAKQASKFVMQLFDKAHLTHDQRKIVILIHGLKIKFDENNNYTLIEEASEIQPVTLREVGLKLGLSHERVRQLNIQATEAMANAIESYKVNTQYDVTAKAAVNAQYNSLKQAPEVKMRNAGETREQRLKRYQQKYGDLLAPN